jgi:hypothetical protein
MIEHQIHSNAFTCLPEYGQFDCGFSHLETSKYIYGCCDVETLHPYNKDLTVRFFDAAKFTTLIPFALLISCKFPFPAVGFKMYSLPTSAISQQNFHTVFIQFMEYTFYFFMETVYCIINFILCWYMNIQNNDILSITNSTPFS